MLSQFLPAAVTWGRGWRPLRFVHIQVRRFQMAGSHSSGGRSGSGCARRRRLRFAAFTLVELLVVIGIIAILIAVLMPALGRVRDQANGVKCSANLRTLMTGALMFAQDHKGHLFGNWSDFQNKDEEKRDFLAGGTGIWQNAPQAGTLWRYIKDENVYRCPARSSATCVGTGSGRLSGTALASATDTLRW